MNHGSLLRYILRDIFINIVPEKRNIHNLETGIRRDHLFRKSSYNT